MALLSSLIIFIFSTSAVLSILPSAIPVKDCYVKDQTKFHGCLTRFIEVEIPKALKSGIPSLKVRSMDPLFLPLVEYSDQGVALQAHVKFINTTAVGGGNLQIKSVSPVDRKARTISSTAFLPSLNCSGQYIMKGNILAMPVDSKGPYTLDMIGLDVHVALQLGLVGPDVKIKGAKITFNVADAILKFHGLMGGDAVGSAISSLIAENSKQMFDDLKPIISHELENAVRITTEDILVGLPPEAFIA